MSVVRALSRHGVRLHRASLLAIALVLAAGVGAGLASLQIAERTDQAYSRYRDDANVAQLVVNPSLATDQTEQLLRSIEGVESVTSDALLTALPDLRGLGGALEDVSDFLQVRVSSDGRYTAQDRPAVHRGRMIREGNEAFISEDTAESLGLGVGDEVPLLFFSSEQDVTLDVDDIVAAAIGSVEVRIVGIGSFSDEVLPDELIPRQKILVTSDVGSRFDCLAPHPEPDDPRGIGEFVAYFFPPNCSASYHYFSLRTVGGDAGAVEVGERLSDVFEEANAQLPAGLRENDIGYFLIPSFAADEAKRLDESLSPVVTALRAFALAAFVVSIALAVILVVRHARRRGDEVAIWRSLGVSRRDRALALVGPSLVATLVGFVVAIASSWTVSGIGAIASARAVDTDAGLGLSRDTAIAAVVVLVLTAVLMGVAVLLSAQSVGRAAAPVGAAPARGSRPARTLGLRAARRGGGAIAVLAGCTLAVLTVAATAVFTASLQRFIDEPDQFGWPYDVAVMVNAGYDNPKVAAIEATLDAADSGVERWGRAALSAGTQVEGSTVPFVGEREGFAAVADTQVVQGRLPDADDEVALGKLTADDLGIDVGDTVEITSHYGQRSGTVTGFVVLPAVGALESDRTSVGTGLLLPPSFFDELAASASDSLGLEGREIADSLGSFVVIDLDDGIDPDVWVRQHEDAMVEWDPFGASPLTYTEPVRPPVVVDVAATQRVPALLAGLLGLAMGVSVVAGVAAGTRARRRELAILRALGGSKAQIRASVRWHALAVVFVGLVVGVPLGVALGRIAYRAFAESIGATSQPVVPLTALGALVVVMVLLGLGAAAMPARWVSSRSTVTEALRPDLTGVPV